MHKASVAYGNFYLLRNGGIKLMSGLQHWLVEILGRYDIEERERWVAIECCFFFTCFNFWSDVLICNTPPNPR